MFVGKETSIASSLEGFTDNNSIHDDLESPSLINSTPVKRSFLPESLLSIISGSRGRRRFSRRRH